MGKLLVKLLQVERSVLGKEVNGKAVEDGEVNGEAVGDGESMVKLLRWRSQ